MSNVIPGSSDDRKLYIVCPLLSVTIRWQGYKLREIVPSPRGLICAMSTEERRMDCRMYVEAEVGKKVRIKRRRIDGLTVVHASRNGNAQNKYDNDTVNRIYFILLSYDDIILQRTERCALSEHSGGLLFFVSLLFPRLFFLHQS